MKIYQVDAFSNRQFSGNPAAVCPMDHWPDESLMQMIANENNLSETAFIVPVGDENYEIRWFTPVVEVDLCGHATLASAYVVFNFLETSLNQVLFHSKNSGTLPVLKNDNLLQMDFPCDDLKETEVSDEISSALNARPKEVWMGKTDLMAVFSSKSEIEQLQPNFFLLNQIEVRGVIATAPGDDCDFVSRFFAPQSGINEDPVTGSAHTSLTPYWAGRLGKASLKARQISSRGGNLICELHKNRVKISGEAMLYMTGTIQLN